MAIEDAAILSRCLAGIGRDGIETALRRYEATRKARTSKCSSPRARTSGAEA